MKRHYMPLLVILICTLIWGSTWLVIKIGLETLPPFLFAGIRFIIATVLLYGLMRVRKLQFPRDWNTWKVLLILGFFQMLDYAFVFWGEQFIDSSIGAILFSTMPFFVVICSYWMLDEHHITWVKITGITISFAGVVMIFIQDIGHSKNSWMGDLAIILAAASGALISVYAKKHANNISPITNTTVQMAVCAVVLFGTGLLTENISAMVWTPRNMGAVVYLGTVGSAVAFVLYMWVIKKVNVIEASIIPVATPIVAVILGWLILDEKLTTHAFLGCALILAGVYMVNILKEDQLPRFMQASGVPAADK